MGDMAQGTMKGFHSIFEWVIKLAYINILWILFTLIGLGLGGVGPATVSVFTVIRKYLRRETGFSIWKEFTQTYWRNFWRANQLMVVMIPLYIFIYMDFKFIRLLPNRFFIDKVVFPGVFMLSILVLILTCYLFAVYVHFNLSFWTNFKLAIIIAGIFPLQTIIILLGLFVFSIIVFVFPAVSLFYLMSVPALIIQASALEGFRKVVKETKV